MVRLRVTARAEYALKAMVELAAVPWGERLKGDRIAAAQGMSLGFIKNILGVLRSGQLVASQRGSEGGYRLARPADQITIGDVVRVMEGPLTEVHGQPPEERQYPGVTAPLLEVWTAVAATLDHLLDSVTLADVAAGELPATVRAPDSDPGRKS